MIFLARALVLSYTRPVSIKSSGAIRSATESDPTTVPKRCGPEMAENSQKRAQSRISPDLDADAV